MGWKEVSFFTYVHVTCDMERLLLLLFTQQTSEGLGTLTLPFSHDLLSVVIEYLYTDEAPTVTSTYRMYVHVCIHTYV